jgi:hypothetical protein
LAVLAEAMECDVVDVCHQRRCYPSADNLNISSERSRPAVGRRNANARR